MTLPIAEFSVSKRYLSGYTKYHHYCNPCLRADRAVIEGARRNGTYARLYLEQNGRCYICRTWHDVLCIDHDHKTMQVRKLLCSGCNSAAGFLKDDPNLAFEVYLYLREADTQRRFIDVAEMRSGR